MRTGVVTAFGNIRRWWRRSHIIPPLDFHISLGSGLFDLSLSLLDEAKVIIFDLSNRQRLVTIYRKNSLDTIRM